MNDNTSHANIGTATNTTEKRTCPCKRLPLILSSLTGAEFGNVHSLQRRGLTEVAKRRDAAGNTALHLAAQHGHVAATALLLPHIDVNTHDSGATPLHRASFAGACATMRLLCNQADCDLLLPDTSFGDHRTALHKAAAGGRFLAVRLLVQEHAVRGTLTAALTAVDAAKRTPLQVAQMLLSHQDEERTSVARWDGVAGGVANWQLCCQILQQAAMSNAGTFVEKVVANSPTSSLPVLNVSNDDDCLDCEAGVCVTKSWEQAFQRGLMQAVARQTEASNVQHVSGTSTTTTTINNTNDDETTTIARTIATNEDQPENGQSQGISNTAQTASPLGRPCEACSKHCLFLYPLQGKLYCRACKRAKR